MGWRRRGTANVPQGGSCGTPVGCRTPGTQDGARRPIRPSSIVRLLRDLTGREMQLLRGIDDPLWHLGRTGRNPALRDRPMIDPARPFFSNIGIRQTVGRVAQRILERDEAVAAFSQDGE